MHAKRAFFIVPRSAATPRAVQFRCSSGFKGLKRLWGASRLSAPAFGELLRPPLRQRGQAPTTPPSVRQITTVAGRGRLALSPSGQVDTAVGVFWEGSTSMPSPGCWILMNT